MAALAVPVWVGALAADPVHDWVRTEWERAGKTAGAWFDEVAAEKAARFFPDYLVHTKGKWAGRPFRLSPWQDAIVRMVFGWKTAEGKRLFRRALIWIARGNGKSEFAAGLLLLAFLFDGELGGEAYVIAADKKQAGIVFTMATRMVQLSPSLAEHIETFKTSLYCAELLASIQPMSGQAEGKHGLSCSVLVGDEMHEWAHGDLYEFVKQSEIKREQPIEILISTAGQARRGYGWVLWEESLKIKDGTFDDPTTLVVIYAAGANDNWKEPATWAKANPNLGVSVQLDDMQKLVERALHSPRLETNFKRYHLDIWVGQDLRWLDIDAWRKGSGMPSLAGDAGWRAMAERCKGRVCYGGLDLSSVSDLTCLLWLFPPDETEKNWLALPRFWVPADNIERRARRDRVPYDIWQARGAVEPTVGNVVDYDPVIAAIHEGMAQFTVRSVAYDPHNATATVNTLMNEGAPMVLMRQGIPSLGAASKELERLTLKGALDCGQHPVMDWMAGNVAKHEDRNGNIMPDKGRSSEKIDGISALVNALAVAPVQVETVAASPWDDPNFSLRKMMSAA
jgi:phage terminase large subunit-like protein